MIAKCPLRANTPATDFRAISALLAARLAGLIDPIFGFSDSHALRHSLPVVGTLKFSGALARVFRQEVER